MAAHKKSHHGHHESHHSGAHHKSHHKAMAKHHKTISDHHEKIAAHHEKMSKAGGKYVISNDPRENDRGDMTRHHSMTKKRGRRSAA